jgi:hypothetical protein
MRDRNVIAELISTPSKLSRLRSNFKLGLQHLLVVIITRTQHHPMLAEGDRLMIAIGRDVFDRENRHWHPNAYTHRMHFSGQVYPRLLHGRSGHL